MEQVENLVLRALLAEKDAKIESMTKMLEQMEENRAENTDAPPQSAIEYAPAGAIPPPENANTPWQLASQIIVVMRASGSFSSGPEWYEATAMDLGEEFHNLCGHEDRPTIQHILLKKWKATNSILDIPELTTSLDRMQQGEAVVLLSTGSEGISSDILAWDVLAKSFPHLTIYMALGTELKFIKRYPQHPGRDFSDGAWLQGPPWSPDRGWAIYSIPRLLAGWYNRVHDDYYTDVLERMQKASRGRKNTSENYVSGGIESNRNSLHLAKRKRQSA